MKLPPYNIFPNIRGNKVTLRQIHTIDMNALVEISYYDAIQAKTVQQAIEMKSRIDKDYLEGNSIHWGIVDNSTNTIVGTCGYYRGFDNGKGELGCVLLPHYRGKGYMTSAMLLAIEFGRNTIGLKRIWAITNQNNRQAIALLERLSFRKIAELADSDVEYELADEVVQDL